MNNPGLIKDLFGRYVLQPTIDQDVQGWPVVRNGKVVAIYLDDTTPELEAKWLPAAVRKYIDALGLIVFVAVAPGDAGRFYHHPGVVELYERYIYGMGSEGDAVVPPSAWGPVPKGYRGFIVQWHFTGTNSNAQPSKRQRARLLASVLARRPRYVFLY